VPLTDIVIRREPIDSPAAAELIRALNDELLRRYPEPGATHFRLEAEEVREGQGAFFVVYSGAEPIGCGAVRIVGPASAEIKRMYVQPAHRGRGVGTALLRALESEARLLGAARVVLETGERQRESLALYRRAGYAEIPRFGEYVNSPLSLCMGKEL
jgi:GNAT superfamily N-acetyltransferase